MLRSLSFAAMAVIVIAASVSAQPLPTTGLTASDRAEMQILGRSAALAIGNEAVTRQVGRGNTARVTQTGTGNIAVQDQTGDHNQSEIVQSGKKNAAIDVQIGSGIGAQIVQTGGATVTLLQRRP